MKIYRKTVSLITTIALLAAILVSTAAVYNGAAASIDYSFSGSNSNDRGYAEGKITLNAGAGTYRLYWADDTKALEGYGEIAELTVSSGSASHSMYAQTAIPVDAERIIAIQSASQPSDKTVAGAAAVYIIPESKRPVHTRADRRYSFASYSDIHMDSNLSAYKYCQTHWAKALQTAYDRDVDFIIGSGDYAHSEEGNASVQAKDWRLYQKILAQSEYCNPVYEAIGNHELWTGADVGTRNFINATGLEGSDNKADKAYFEKTLNGDHFIFMSLEGGFYPNKTEEFSTEQLDWLEGLLQKYSGDGNNIYIIEHSLFYKYGAGDRTSSSPYYDIPLSDNQASTRRFKSLLETYRDTIFISGHTHIAFSEQYNYSNNDGTSGQMIHNSSVGGTRHIVNGSLNYTYYEDQTEGYIVDVYDDGIIFNGANLYYNEYDPNCCYLVRTSQQAYESMNPSGGGAKAAVSYSQRSAAGSASSAEYILGDVNGDGLINASDATCIQRFAAKMIALSDVQKKAADVNADGIVNTSDATTIQRYTAKLILSFITPAEDKAVAEYLDLYYRYSSYDCYQALKKAYKNSADSAELRTLSDALLAVVDPSNVDSGEYNIYFENTNNWSKVYAYCWTGSNEEAKWPGKTAEYVGKNSLGNSIYCYKVNVEEYGNIVFSNGSGLQTKDIALSDNNICYYPTSSDSKASVSSYAFNSSMLTG